MPVRPSYHGREIAPQPRGEASAAGVFDERKKKILVAPEWSASAATCTERSPGQRFPGAVPAWTAQWYALTAACRALEVIEEFRQAYKTIAMGAVVPGYYERIVKAKNAQKLLIKGRALALLGILVAVWRIMALD